MSFRRVLAQELSVCVRVKFTPRKVVPMTRGPVKQHRKCFSTGCTALKSSEVRFRDMDEELQAKLTEERAADKVDVCIVGGGPAGLAAAIKLKQLQLENEDARDIRVVVLEKAPDMGSHIVSGAVIEPRALRELFPNSEYYDENGDGIPLPADIVTHVEKDALKFLYGDYAIPLPEPPQILNHGNYIASLSEVVKYLAEQAEELGVEVYPSTAVSEVLYNSEGAVKGVATKDMGIGKNGVPKDSFERGMEFHARVTVFAEGCHGSLSKEIINKYNLREGRQAQTYGLGIKEIWEIDPAKFNKGSVSHTFGYPLDLDTYGGGFMYHFGDGLVAVGLVIGLDYKNPWISPYQEFQKMKHHPFYKGTLEGGKCISYAARALNEGGYQSVPKLNFPGGVLIGASAGFMNVPKVKGSHTAMKTGMLAAESIYDRISTMKKIMTEEDEGYDPEIHDVEEPVIDLPEYEKAYKNSWVHDELYEVRNIRPSFGSGFVGGVCYSGIDSLLLKGQVAWTFSHHSSDAAVTKSADQYAKIEYPKPDGKISFDLLTSVSRTGTYHDEDEKNHLRIPDQDMQKHTDMAWPKFKGIENRFCPAGVYEYVEDESSKHGVKFQINSQNCIHCKTCDIKVPTQDINWTVPEGGDGPKYVMT